MSGIGPNISGAILQTQIMNEQASKNADAQRNKRVRDSEELARLAEQQQHEVEDTYAVTQERAARDDDQQHNPQQSPQDTYEHEDAPPKQSPEDAEVSEEQESPSPPADDTTPSDSDEPPNHIDISI